MNLKHFISGQLLCAAVFMASFSSCNEQTPVRDGIWADAELVVKDSTGFYVPEDFTGISFESDAILPNHRGAKGWFFAPSNKQLVTLFKNTGMRILRIGGGTVEEVPHSAHERAAIDSLFAFAKAAGVKVVYSFPLRMAIPEENAETAKYIWDNYRNLLDCFTVGNEPNCPPYWDTDIRPIKNYQEFYAEWKKYVDVIRQRIPAAKFTGPESGGWNWTEEFARDTKDSDIITVITHHQYPGGRPVVKGTNTPLTSQQAIDAMLSPEWLTGEYKNIQSHSGDKVHPYGYRCRLTEANDHLGGIPGASNAFAGALWALDYMHWQAQRGLVGINFHNNQWLTTCTFTHDADWNYVVSPKSLAIRAFDEVAGGYELPVEIQSPDSLNVTGYAIRGEDYLYVTLINKEHGETGRGADVTVCAENFTKGRPEVMYMTAPDNDPAAMQGATIGGDSMDNNRVWSGSWSSLPRGHKGHYLIPVTKSSAAVVRIRLK